MSELFNGAREALERAKQKAAPMVGKVRDAVKEGAEKVGDLFRKDAPGLNVKNEFFADLDQQVRAQKEAAKNQAEEMQRRLHEMLHGKKEEPKDEPKDE